MQHSPIQGTCDRTSATVDVVVISGAEMSTLKHVVDVASGEAVQALNGSAHDVVPYGGVECSLLCDNGDLESCAAFTQWISEVKRTWPYLVC